MRTASALLALLLALLVTGCGGADEKRAREPGTVTCGGTPLEQEPDLPAGFPKPAATTYLSAERRGPTTVVDGFLAGELGDAYEAYREAFESAGYSILFDELEAADAEISYRDPARSTSGQVALRERCVEAGRVAVHITARPA